VDAVHAARLESGGLEPLLRRFAEPRYREGYERGVHDHDAARIAGSLIDLRAAAGLLGHDPAARACAALAWNALNESAEAKRWPDRARAASALLQTTGAGRARDRLIDDLNRSLRAWRAAESLPDDDALCAR